MSIELISVHIPKTAGTSFRQSLCSEYGVDSVLRLDFKPHANVLLADEILYEAGTPFPSKTKVIHGHFLYADLIKNSPSLAKVPVITWLRNPVERVVSNYFYLSERLKEMLQAKPYNNILGKMQRSLMEYAADPLNQNRIAWFLQDMRPQDFTFIGLVEEYESDFLALKKTLHWTKAETTFVNKTKEKRSEISKSELKQIEDWNQEDMIWYESVLRLRKPITF